MYFCPFKAQNEVERARQDASIGSKHLEDRMVTFEKRKLQDLKVSHIDKYYVDFTNFLYAQLVGTYYGMAQASVCLSVCLSGLLSVGLSTKLVNTIQTKPFHRGSSNLVHILLMIRGQHLSICTHCCKTL